MVIGEVAVGGLDRLTFDVDGFHIGLHESLAGMCDRETQRVGDSMRRQLPGGDLIEERGEQVVVVAIEERQLDLAWPHQALQPPNEMQARETTADHDDPLRHQFGFPTACSTRASSVRYACVIGSAASSSFASASRSRAAFRFPARSCAKPASAR